MASPPRSSQSTTTSGLSSPFSTKAKAPKPAQQPKKKKEKKPKSDDDEDDEPAAAPVVKRVNPLDSLPKSTMVLDEFKRQYSNNEAPVFFDWLSKNFDSEGGPSCFYHMST